MREEKERKLLIVLIHMLKVRFASALQLASSSSSSSLIQELPLKLIQIFSLDEIAYCQGDRKIN
jgi:hypothetical protein